MTRSVDVYPAERFEVTARGPKAVVEVSVDGRVCSQSDVLSLTAARVLAGREARGCVVTDHTNHTERAA